MSKNRRIAVVAVHGVADQKLGDTAQALAELLITQAPNGYHYGPATRTDVTIQVPRLEPLCRIAKTRGGLKKQLNQSTGSDFLRERWTAERSKRSLYVRCTSLSSGAEFTDYLLAKADQHEMPTETYTVPHVGLSRSKGTTADHVDIFEMYWADLSRLSGSVPRILTELFTLLFRFSSLGRDTIQIAAAHFPKNLAWRALQCFQTALDWLYSRVLALLFLQLVMLALMLVPFGMGSSYAPVIHKLLAGSALALWVLWVSYGYQNHAMAVLGGGALGIAFWISPAAWVVGLTWIVILSVLYDWWLRVCEKRFKMVRTVGWVLWPISIVVVVLFAATDATEDLGMWVTGALSALEVVLLLIMSWWVLVGLLLPVWLGTGHFAARVERRANDDEAIRENFQARSSVATGRLGLIVSLGFFLVLSMSAWALVTTGVEQAVKSFQYSPIIFAHASSPGAGASGGAFGLGTAALFLQDRFVKSTEAFSVIAPLLVVLVVYLLVVLLPSVLSELKLIKQFEPLGRWLTGGYRRLDSVVASVVTPGVILAALIGMVFLAFLLGLQAYLDSLITLFAPSARLSGRLLEPLIISAATATVGLTAAGHLLSRYVPWMRAPLDAALDVDNHFREFPRNAIPRACIFSRYVAVLDHLARENYERIVIVSHSQGTVISAELFRYMKERAADPGAKQSTDRVAELWQKMDEKVWLLTAGCPLRQLYAARFPVMYEWVLKKQSDRMGPVARDIGVVLWVNVYATGDYVGRWLHSRCTKVTDRAVPMIDELDSTGKNTYLPTATNNTSWRTLMDKGTEKDISLGAGAHTHYFDKDQKVVASIVDALLAV